MVGDGISMLGGRASRERDEVVFLRYTPMGCETSWIGQPAV